MKLLHVLDPKPIFWLMGDFFPPSSTTSGSRLMGSKALSPAKPRTLFQGTDNLCSTVDRQGTLI